MTNAMHVSAIVDGSGTTMFVPTMMPGLPYDMTFSIMMRTSSSKVGNGSGVART